jgi:hypothetical protein
MISRNIDIVVTSVLQTTAGKMIFGRYIEGPAAQTGPMSSTSGSGAPAQATAVLPAARGAQPNAK